MTARRPRPRLLPVVIAAAASLLALKTLGLVTQGGYVLGPSAERERFARALTEPRRNFDPDPEPTGATPAKKDTKEPAKDAAAKDAPAPAKPADPSSQPLPPPVPAAERQVLEKLSERRRQLDDRAKELDLREQLLKSAEQKIEERLGELKGGEKPAEDGGAPKDKSDAPFKSLVTIYEAMKPRDAAKVFERMEPRALAPLVSQMNPRKFSEILAQMTPESAEKLTQALMRRSDPAHGGARSQPAHSSETPKKPELEELPRLERQPKGT
ncbi:MAG TPA: flagellar protein FlbB [Beijerinckiaceae bacterium]|nr:flagellar protein FlbB [Beijerinckiaceae bacterium]